MKHFHRRNLPHLQPDGRLLFLTYRLYGSLPKEVMERLRMEREKLRQRSPILSETPRDRALREGKRLFALTDTALAQELRSPEGRTPRYLSQPAIARIVIENLFHFHGTRYNVHRYVVMPNHVHFLLEPLLLPGAVEGQSGEGWRSGREGKINQPLPETSPQPEYWPLEKILHSLKGYTGQMANRHLGRQGLFWQDEYYDHWVRDRDSYNRLIAYIDQNPVEAALCRSPEEWPWSSAGSQRPP